MFDSAAIIKIMKEQLQPNTMCHYSISLMKDAGGNIVAVDKTEKFDISSPCTIIAANESLLPMPEVNNGASQV